MNMNPTRAWLGLMAMSLGSTLAAASGLRGPMLIIPAMLLAGGKARLILANYLGLAAAPRWLRGFEVGLAALLILMAVLAVAAGRT